MSNVGSKTLLIGLLLFGLVVTIGYQVLIKERIKSLPIKSASLPIKYVRIEGVFQYLSKNEVQAVLQPLVLTGFFDADMQAIHTAVSAMPWVETVTVKRIWPDAIDIKVHEKKP